MLRRPSTHGRGFLIALALLPGSSLGCATGVHFQAHTVVAPTGAVTRITRFIAIGSESRDEIEGRYLLPPGGTWVTETRKTQKEGRAIEERVDVYQVERRCPAGCPPSSDHVRRALFSDRAARNEFRVDVRNYLFATSFLYEERFRDIVTAENLERTVRRIYGGVIEKAASALERECGAGMSVPRLRATIRRAFDPLLDKYLGALRRQGLSRFFQEEGTQKELESLLEPASIAAHLAAVLPPPAGTDADTWRHTIMSVYEDATKSAGDGSVFDKELEEELFGVFGFELFTDNKFEIDVVLPGTLQESNATTATGNEGNLLAWSFKPDDVQADGHLLMARSRVVYPQRIALGATALVALLAGGWVVRRRPAGKGEP